MACHFTGEDVRAAYERIKDHVRRTPLDDSLYLGTEECRYRFKLESQQLGRSFKIRGVLNVLLQLAPAQLERGVGTVSTGNHAIALAYAAKQLGIECVVIVPVGTSRTKLDRMRLYGARIMTMGGSYDEALVLGRNYIDCNELVYVDPGKNDPVSCAGHGTVGYEIALLHPSVDTIVVPVGGGGLITGVAVGARALRPDMRIVGVQPSACPSVYQSLNDQFCYTTYPLTGETVCDSVAGGIGILAYEMLPGLVDEWIVVDEPEVRSAVRFMVMEERILLEGASAMAVAAVREYPERVGGSSVAIVVSGGNADGKRLASVLNEADDSLDI
ncbi:MAG: threonine/serine dehydratase [Atopobiaceae bacterium]|nr:threonine/serine dehydratase [Atopobiaceae bacterium]